MRRAGYLLIALLFLAPIAAAILGHFLGAGVLHPMNLNPDRGEQVAKMLAVTGAAKEDFIVMMDSRAHGASGGAMATYGWKERYDTIAIVNALYATENVRNLDALGVSMGAAIALQSAAHRSRSCRRSIRELARGEL